MLEGTRQCRGEKGKVGKTSLQDRGDGHGKTQGTMLRPTQPQQLGNREQASWQYLRTAQWEGNKEKSLPTFFLTTLECTKDGGVSWRIQLHGIFPYSSRHTNNTQTHTHTSYALTHTPDRRDTTVAAFLVQTSLEESS